MSTGKMVPPNGGWGWMVVIGAAMINMVNQAMFANYGLIFGEHLEKLAGGRATAITLVMATNVVVSNSAGLLVGPLLKRMAIRTLCLIAIFLVGTGMIISSFSTEIWHICIGYGVVTGLGLGMIQSGTFLAINDYFTTKKSTAVGISMAGTAIGQMVMPTFIGMLLSKYEFSGTTFILGFMSYSGFIGAMFFRPILCCKNCASPENPQDAGKENEANTCDMNSNDKQIAKLIGPKKKESENLLDGTLKLPKKNSMIQKNLEHHYNDSAIQLANSQTFSYKEDHTWKHKISSSLGLSLLKDLTYVHITFGLALGYVSSISFSTFYPMFLQDEVGFNVMSTTYCMTALSLSDVIGRITSAELCRRMKLGNRSSFMLGCFFLGVSRSCLVELSQFYYIMAVGFITGYFRAISVININLVISEYIEKDKLPQAVGLNMVAKALVTMTVGQSLGFLKDYFSYSMCIHMLDIILFVVVATYFIEIGIKRLINKQKASSKRKKINIEI